MYRYHFDVRQPHGTGRAGGIELAINGATHTELLEAGIIPSGPTPNSICTTCGGGGYDRSVGWWTGWYDDAELLLNKVTTWVFWNYNGSQVTAYDHSDVPYVWSSDPAGPWYIVSHSNTGGYGDSGHTWVYSNSYADMRNTGFCGGKATDSYYEPNQARGYNNGDVGGGMNTYAGGPCSGLIHYEYNFV